MRTLFRALPLLIVSLLAGGSLGQAQPVSTSPPTRSPDVARPLNGAGPSLAEGETMMKQQKPIFIENRGQWDRRARFLMRTGGMDLWVTDNGIVYDLHRESPIDGRKGSRLADVDGALLPNGPAGRAGRNEPAETRRSGQVVRVQFDGAGSDGHAVGMERRPEEQNYFLGNDPKGWATNVPLYDRAVIEHLYDGINAVLYVDGGVPRYDLVVAPGADPSKLRMRFEGADGVRLLGSGTLAIATRFGDLEQRGLYAYQQIDGKRRQVPCRFVVMRDGAVEFRTGSYDRNRPLVIDPLVFSTLVGGADEDYATAIDLDGNGNIYVSGWTYSTDFPVTSGAYQATSPSNFDLLVAKLDPAATGSAQLVSSTFIGGSTADGVIDMAIDATGKVYLTGFTDSDDYPTSAGALAATRGGNVDGFVTTIDLAATGASQLVYSTYLGGTDFEQSGGIAVDASGRIVVAGITASTDFPTTSDAISTAPSPGSYDATVTRLDPSASGSAQLEYSTLIGGSSYDIGYSVAVDGSSGIYLTGYTISTDFPTSSGAFATTLAGESDIFVTKLAAPDSNGMRIVYSTYLGGSGSDNEYGIALDATGRIYLAGWTNSTDFPTSASAYSSSNAGGTDAFVATIDPSASGNAQLAYGTYIGGGDEDFAYGVALDADGRIWFTGWTASTDYPTTADAYSATNSGGANDALVTKLDMTATGSAQLAYSTYIGGSGDDQPNGIAVDPNGRVFIAGYTTSSDYPTSSGAYSSTNNGGYDLFISELTFTSIDLTSFNGGSYCAGTVENIDWTSSGMTNVKIELSGDGGASYPTTIVASTAASAGSYAWSIPANQTVGSSYRIRISDASDPTTSNQSDADFTINAPTAITTQPQATIACIGSPVTMSVVATGTGLAYQWRKAGLPITGATSSSYTITSPTTASAGYYSVVVTGSCGTPVTSAQVFLTIRTPQVITQQPTSRTICQGANTTFTVTATGSSLTYQWRLNGTNIPGANSASYTIHNASSSNAGAYTVVVGGSCPISVTSNNAMLIVNPTTVLTYQPTSQSVCQYQPAYFSVGAAGTGVTFQWRYNGTNIAGATSPSYVAYNPGNYSVVVTGACGNPVTSNTVSMSWLPSTYISSQPGSPTVCENTYVTLWVGASGYGTLHYQWMKNGVIINGNDSPYLNLGPVSTFSAGTYRVNVWAGCGGATSNDAVVTVNPATRIISQPTGATRALGTSVTFSVSATGTGLSYQWKKNNAPINGATGSSYTINNVSFSSAATYSVVVTGQCGTVTSNGAVLTVTLLKPTEPSTGAEATAPAIAVTPNPASDAARIELTIPSALQGARTLKLYDESGGLVRDLTSALGDGGSQSMMLDVSDLPSGRYHVQLRIAGHDAVGATVVVVR